jgi:hypothetical protein
MAMNKTETARMAKLEEELRISRALRWPTDPRPSPMTQEEIKAACIHNTKGRSGDYGYSQKVAHGWFANGYREGEVTKGCSDGYSHDRRSTERVTTQTGGIMYRTEAEAWRAIRHEKVRAFATVLAKIDQHIERAETKTHASSVKQDAEEDVEAIR